MEATALLRKQDSEADIQDSEADIYDTEADIQEAGVSLVQLVSGIYTYLLSS